MPIPTVDEIKEVLKKVHDPEIRIGIVDLGLIYDIIISDDGKVLVKMTLTTPACPYGDMLIGMVHTEAQSVKGVTEVEVALVWEPTWDPKEMCSDAAKDVLGIW